MNFAGILDGLHFTEYVHAKACTESLRCGHKRTELDHNFHPRSVNEEANLVTGLGSGYNLLRQAILLKGMAFPV